MRSAPVYGAWETVLPVPTRCSYLYSLQPIGIGTPAVESFTGYITRLAAAHAVETGVDYSTEPTTLVSFELTDVAEGTRLTVVESGFDGIPLSRRATAYRGNDEGWNQQMVAIERYLSGAA